MGVPGTEPLALALGTDPAGSPSLRGLPLGFAAGFAAAAAGMADGADSSPMG